MNHPLVVGVDFLFWFCYGEGSTDAGRAQRFETGLKLLEQIPCPLVVGDIPDASSATNTGILSIAQVPSGEFLPAAWMLPDAGSRLAQFRQNAGQALFLVINRDDDA